MKSNQTLKEIVLELLKKSVHGYLEISNNPIPIQEFQIRLEYSRNEKFGDYSTSFIMENKKHLTETPEKIAEHLISKLKQLEIFQEVSFTKPGFINFRINPNYIFGYIKSHIISSDRFPQAENKQSINFEFVSANPTGPLNIVSARAAAMGDSICNLLEKIGNKVHREFYVNDYGNQVFLLGISTLCRLREHLGTPLSYQGETEELSIEEILEKNILPYEGYRGEYLKEIAIGIYEKNKLLVDDKLGKKSWKELAELCSSWTVSYNLKTQKRDLEGFGVYFNEFFRESSLHNQNKVLSVLDEIKKSGDIDIQEGKQVFLSTKYGDDKDRVVVREDGRPTYLLADIAYHKNKMERGFTRMINIWGPDHHGYIARLRGAILSMGYPKDSFQVLIAQQVNLLEQGEKVKMSKRLGQIQTMKDLFIYLGNNYKDVGRYFFVMRTLEAPLDFDLQLAKEESDKNPVYYIQYAHARICSIFRENKVEPNYESTASLKITEDRQRLLFWIARFSEELFDSAISMEPHRLANYLQNLSKAFTKFYLAKENRLKDADDTTKQGLAYLCEATRICLLEGLNLLGISAPERMEKTDGN